MMGGGDNNNNDNINNNNNNMSPSRHSPQKSGRPSSCANQQKSKGSGSSSNSKNRKSKDDMSMAQSQSKDKVKANPYATIKMWRPVAMAANSASDGEVYQTFSNFDALRQSPVPDSPRDHPRDQVSASLRADGLPPTGDLRNQQQPDVFLMSHHHNNVNSRHQPVAFSGKSRPPPRNNPAASSSTPAFHPSSLSLSPSTTHQVNGFVELPADYPMNGVSPTYVERQVSFEDQTARNTGPGAARTSSSSHVSKPPTRPPPAIPSSLPPSQSNSAPVPPPPLPSSPAPSLPNGFGDRTAITTSSSNTNHHRSKQLHSNSSRTTDLSATAPAALASPPANSAHDNSFGVVSDGTTTSVKLVLSHSYPDVELAGRDVERLLAELKLTMDSLRTRSASNPSSSSTSTSTSGTTPGQLGLCLSEFHAQTKLFVQAAKAVVSAASDSQEDRLLTRLQAAVHALARLFLHGQATMLMLPSPSDAQRLGMQLIKASNAFKATLGAAHAAMGRGLSDPHMKYLMRQATNLAALLGALLGTIKEVQGM